MARRKNASFTGSPLSGHGDGSRELVEKFYNELHVHFPGSTPVPIPPPESVHPKHDRVTQAFIFVDYTVRKIAPIALDTVGLRTEASKLRKLEKIVGDDTAYAAELDVHRAHRAATQATINRDDRDARAVRDAARYAYNTIMTRRLIYAAIATYAAAHLDPDATWAAVNEMLAAL
jgi:hypothetical protein